MKALPIISLFALLLQRASARGLWARFWQEESSDDPAVPAPAILPRYPTIIPTPSLTSYPTNITAYPTAFGRTTGTASATGGLPTANNSLLSITLHYRTTLSTQSTSSSSTGIPPTNNSSSHHHHHPTPSLGQSCQPHLHQIICNSPTTFSLCIATPGGSDPGYFFFMGAVADGYSCNDGSIEHTNNGSCTPRGRLRCRDEGRGSAENYITFFLCEEGMFFLPRPP